MFDLAGLVQDLAEISRTLPSTPELDAPINLTDLTYVIIATHKVKALRYGSSYWEGQEVSAFYNLARKFDRLKTVYGNPQNLANIQANGFIPDSGATSSLLDLVVYGLLWLTRRVDKFPKELQQEIETVLKELE